MKKAIVVLAVLLFFAGSTSAQMASTPAVPKATSAPSDPCPEGFLRIEHILSPDSVWSTFWPINSTADAESLRTMTYEKTLPDSTPEKLFVNSYNCVANRVSLYSYANDVIARVIIAPWEGYADSTSVDDTLHAGDPPIEYHGSIYCVRTMGVGTDTSEVRVVFWKE